LTGAYPVVGVCCADATAAMNIIRRKAIVFMFNS